MRDQLIRSEELIQYLDDQREYALDFVPGLVGVDHHAVIMQRIVQMDVDLDRLLVQLDILEDVLFEQVVVG